MTIEEVTQKRKVLVGMKFDSCSRELLGWAVFKVAEPGDCVVAVHVRRSSGNAPRGKLLLDGHIETYGSLCSSKKVCLIGQISTGNSVRRALVREAKNHSAAVLILGISNPNAIWGWNSIARYCSKQLPPTTDVLAIHNGRIVFRRFNSSQLPAEGRRRRSHGDLKPSWSLTSSPSASSEFGESELGSSSVRSSFEVLTESGSGDSNEEIRRKRPSDSCLAAEQKPGWPLLRRATPADSREQLSVIQWAMSLPDRSLAENRQDLRLESLSEELKFESMGEIGKRLEFLLKKNSSGCCKWLSYELLETATSKFHSDNMIGKGGWNQVYKGTLKDGKLVAVKIRKSSSREAREDFIQELEIISSLKHNSITPLVGVCIRDFDLISVYHFFPRGSLEEKLHDKVEEESSLSWEERFRIAVKVAEALNHLHIEASRPVIHRDVKSANILLSDGLEPQLSDFGLAIWGPTSSSFMTQPDVVGTFGYLAPEYFMYGKVSDKIDVYSFGVVLLELISGKEAIIVASEDSKAQQSLVMWAKEILECGNWRHLLDPNLNQEDLDEAQFQRMVIAAKLCTTRAARLRPKMSEVLKLLQEDTDVVKWAIRQGDDIDDDGDDEVYPDTSPQLHLNLAFLDVEETDSSSSHSSSSSDQGSCTLSWEDYLKGRIPISSLSS